MPAKLLVYTSFNRQRAGQCDGAYGEERRESLSFNSLNTDLLLRHRQVQSADVYCVWPTALYTARAESQGVGGTLIGEDRLIVTA
jgi:hypothetical protein